MFPLELKLRWKVALHSRSLLFTFGDGRKCLLLCASKVLLGDGKPGFQRPKVALVIFGLFFSHYSKERPKVTPKVSRSGLRAQEKREQNLI